ncbi:MAG: tRNA (adenosine(37)-N6)-threonylcarbamoyltransferase complex ATPase subunit type 1 TsaE [Cryomorphaceae bacterium]|nr:tRNA (adenosine(37)-N6)-threonylcarbamoyltransferase complex ATPase subunit type 1 TsaE [Cryomorphaceae bacterium]
MTAFNQTFSLSEIDRVARALLTHFPDEKIFLLEGNLGAGKTTLIQSLCRAIGVTENVSSPTYGLVNTYAGANGKSVFHFDLYRLESPEEALDIGIEEYFDQDAYCFVEWPKKIVSFVPENFVSIKLENAGENRTLRAQTTHV